MSDNILVSVRDLSVQFQIGRSLFGGATYLRAVQNISMDIEAGTFFGLVGESGSGKTTLGRAILKAVPIAEISGAVNAVPADISDTTPISASLADNLGSAAKKFVKNNDGSKLGALDSMIPSKPRGTPFAG